MRIYKTLLFFILCGVCSIVSVNAQPTAKDVMQGNAAVYDLINDYVENSNLTENYVAKVNVFKSLFASNQSKLYMEHLFWMNENADKQMDSVILNDYCRFYQYQQGSFQQGSYTVSDVSFAMINMTNDEATYKVDLNKSYKISGQNDLHSFKLQMDIVYSYSRRYAKITRIKCVKKDKRMVPSIMANYVKYENTLYVPKTIRMEKFDKSTIKLGETVEQVNLSSFNKLKSKESVVYQYNIEENKKGRYKEISVATIKNAVGLEIGFAHPVISPLKNLNTVGDFDGDTKFSSYDFHIGAQYLRQVFARDRHRVSVEAGLQLGLHWQRFSADRYREEVFTSDIDGDSYTRLTTVADYKEKSRAWRFSIPVVARYDYYVLRDLSIFVRGGIKFNMLFLKPISAGFDATYAGQYGPELFDLYIDQRGYYDFGHFGGNSLSMNVAKKMKWNMESVLSLGLQYHISETWSVEALAAWQYKFIQGDKNDGTALRLTEDSQHFQSVIEQMGEPVHTMEYQIRVKYNF